MNQKIQLLHPEGKHASRIDKGKYDIIRNSILRCLKPGVEFTHTEIVNAVVMDLSQNKIGFEGSVGWYLESVKLDLEARKEIKRLSDKTPVRFISLLEGSDSRSGQDIPPDIKPV
jgi:hypothetical protein